MDFSQITVNEKEKYEALLAQSPQRGCEQSFVNLFCWGRQKIAFYQGCACVFSQYDRKSVYLFPVGGGDKKAALDSLIDDAARREIPCRIVGMTKADCLTLEQLYPGRFRVHTDRDSFDYLYAISDLCDLSGRKYQKKRNHLNRFLQENPTARTEPITDENLPEVRAMVEQWYTLRLQEDPTRDFHMERAAIGRALGHLRELQLEGLLLRVEGTVVAMTLGSRLSENTFDVHFEKAFDRLDGAYAAINRDFARYLREKYPALVYLNREDDMGLEGLRQAKLSYHPAMLGEKYWACLLEEDYDY